jgi:hypothetical protein
MKTLFAGVFWWHASWEDLHTHDITKMNRIPVAPVDGSAPAISLYDVAVVDEGRCRGRRTDKDHADRRWAPFVYAAYQCKKLPVSLATGGPTDLCETCARREAAGEAGVDGWHGRVGSAIAAKSQIGGSPWFYSKEPKWAGVARIKTARMEARLDRVPRVEDVEIQRFIRSACDLNIEDLSAKGQISGQQLRDMVCALKGQPLDAEAVVGHGTKKELCALVRRLMRGEDITVKFRWAPVAPPADMAAELAALKAEVEALRAWKAAVLAATTA